MVVLPLWVRTGPGTRGWKQLSPRLTCPLDENQENHLSPLHRWGKLAPVGEASSEAPVFHGGMAGTQTRSLNSTCGSLASRYLLPKPCQLTFSKWEICVRKATHENKVGACSF